MQFCPSEVPWRFCRSGRGDVINAVVFLARTVSPGFDLRSAQSSFPMASVGLVPREGHGSKPSPHLNWIFMSTLNSVAKSLTAVSATAGEGGRWKPIDHLRYIAMLVIWFTLWILRVLIDYFAYPVGYSPTDSLESFPCAEILSASPHSSSFQMILHNGIRISIDGPPAEALDRALTHILALVNEIPVGSRKYQFAVAMAERIVEENNLCGSDVLREINRRALSAAFARTSALLRRSLQSPESSGDGDSVSWQSRLLHAIPLGIHLAAWVKQLACFCISILFQPEATGVQRRLAAVRRREEESVTAEKLAHELLWFAKKMRSCGNVAEAVEQWSSASELASLALTANARVQAAILEILAILVPSLVIAEYETRQEVKFRLLVLWLPFFCHAINGIAYPVLSGFERAEMERVMEEVVTSLPAVHQEVVLANWLQDFAASSSDWPNLQRCYDRWCRASRRCLL